uniref:Transmembrane protein n=1 Tax=Panagrolaimus sp. ES5 TaxID=591445 RepID=A0AC34FHB5_9BILA
MSLRSQNPPLSVRSFYYLSVFLFKFKIFFSVVFFLLLCSFLFCTFEKFVIVKPWFFFNSFSLSHLFTNHNVLSKTFFFPSSIYYLSAVKRTIARERESLLWDITHIKKDKK